MRQLTPLLFAFAIFCIPSFAVGQTEELEQKSMSIEKMRKRVAQIEKEMDEFGREKANEMGNEAFGLMAEIDKAFTQIKSSYEQQVIDLNQKMQRKWQQIEAGNTADREKINRQLSRLEKDWDQTFERLTVMHDEHLIELKQSLTKVRGEFSKIAGKAQAQLESSSFEAVARWEKGHEIFLSLNRTYVKIVGNQVDWLGEKLDESPEDAELQALYATSRDRYLKLQKNLRERQSSHLEHLRDELRTRISQLEQTYVWTARQDMFSGIDGLYDRMQNTWENLQQSFHDSMEMQRAALKVESDQPRKSKLESVIAHLKSDLRKSYLDRAMFTTNACVEIEERIKGSANANEKATWKAKVTDLRLLAYELERKAFRLDKMHLKLSILR